MVDLHLTPPGPDGIGDGEDGSTRDALEGRGQVGQVLGGLPPTTAGVEGELAQLVSGHGSRGADVGVTLLARVVDRRRTGVDGTLDGAFEPQCVESQVRHHMSPRPFRQQTRPRQLFGGEPVDGAQQGVSGVIHVEEPVTVMSALSSALLSGCDVTEPSPGSLGPAVLHILEVLDDTAV